MKPQRPPLPSLRGFTMFDVVRTADGREGVILDIFYSQEATVGFWNKPLREGLETASAQKEHHPLDDLTFVRKLYDNP